MTWQTALIVLLVGACIAQAFEVIHWKRRHQEARKRYLAANWLAQHHKSQARLMGRKLVEMKRGMDEA